jgi:hypothetical protein
MVSGSGHQGGEGRGGEGTGSCCQQLTAV